MWEFISEVKRRSIVSTDVEQRKAKSFNGSLICRYQTMYLNFGGLRFQGACHGAPHILRCGLSAAIMIDPPIKRWRSITLDERIGRLSTLEEISGD